MLQQIARVHRPAARIEVGGRRGGRHALAARADRHGDHVLLEPLLVANDPVIVTKVGATRGPDASCNKAFSVAELAQAVHDNPRHLDLDVLEVVNLRSMFDVHGPADGSLEAPLTALARSPACGTSTTSRIARTTR